VSIYLQSDERQSATRALRVQAVFRVADDQQAQQIAARMIDRAHEVANLPECECDVDVSVELVRPENGGGLGPSEPAGARAPGSPVKH
jgi:hypothetical protein